MADIVATARLSAVSLCHDVAVAQKRKTNTAEVIAVPPPRAKDIRDLPGGRLPLAALLPKPCTWVLAGGGAHGAAQLGALQAMAETDVVADALLGTSAGALSGGIYAEDPVAGASRLSYVWANLGLADVVTDGWWGLLRPTSLTKPSLADSSGERASLESILVARSFDELQVPFGAVATDITSGEPAVLEHGELIPALLASSAIPGVLPPVHIGGRWYMDGLASANLPASLAYRRGAGSIVAFDTSPPVAGAITDKAPAAALPQLVPMLNAVLSKQQRVSSLAGAAAHVPVIYLPTPAPLTGSLSFTTSLEMARQSYELASDFLADLYRRFGVGGVGELAAGLYARPDALAPAPPSILDVLVPVEPQSPGDSTDSADSTDSGVSESMQHRDAIVTQSNHGDAQLADIKGTRS